MKCYDTFLITSLFGILPFHATTLDKTTPSQACSQQTPEMTSVCPCPRSCQTDEVSTADLCVKGGIICIPANYTKFELPNELIPTEVRYVAEMLCHRLLIYIAPSIISICVDFYGAKEMDKRINYCMVQSQFCFSSPERLFCKFCQIQHVDQ